jgi:hypothetical protein
MNFFGHAVAALADDDGPRFLLGAMLPDLAGMAGARMGEVDDPEVARGIAHHHETDKRFHGHGAFLDLCGDALEQLTRAGCERAPARAVGHVGSELLLDGLLSHDAGARAAYERAMRHAVDARLVDAVQWLRGDADQLQRLLMRLRHAPVPEGYREPEFVAERLERILAPRRRLALQARDRGPVRAWLCDARERLEATHASLLDDLRGRD